MRSRMAQPWSRTIQALCAILFLCSVASAQTTHPQPVTDSSSQASPIKAAPASHIDDASAQASPIPPSATNESYVLPHTAINVRLDNAIDSGRLKNGETVHGTLAAPVSLAPRGALSAGTPVELTVVETLPAGRIYAAGEFSLQLLRVGPVTVYTDTLTYRGEPGHKDLPDSAPAVGTDAGLPGGASLTFHVLPPPEAATNEPRPDTSGPGSVNGVASGNPPSPGTSPATRGSNPNGSQAQQQQPANSMPTNSSPPR